MNNGWVDEMWIHRIRRRRHALWLAATLLAAQTVWGAADAARELVVRTAQQVIQAIKKEPDPAQRKPEDIYRMLDDVVVPHFDFESMAEWVLARTWKELDTQQRRRFMTEFRTLLVRIYAVSLAQYRDQQIRYMPLRAPAEATEVTVRTQVIQQAGAPAIPIDYRMHFKGEEWKVYDVIVDGVSLVANYRTSFAQEIRKDGVDSLIRRLAQHNRGES